MDEVIDRLVVQVRADTAAFCNAFATLRGTLDVSRGIGADLAGQKIESALLKAVRTGKFGFEDLKQVALSVMSEIAAGMISGASGSSGGGSSGGLLSLGANLLSGIFGAPGRATGGPVSAGRAYRVGENGPEWFVPGAEGRIANGAQTGQGRGRDVRVAISINGAPGAAPASLARSSKQVARAVRRAVERAD